MKRIYKFLILSITLVSLPTTPSTSRFITTPVLTYLKARPQSFNGARKVAGEFGKTHNTSNSEKWYGNFDLTPAYEQSFNATDLTECFFGNTVQNGTDCRTLKVEGSTANDKNRDMTALFADYFYLPTDFKSSLTFNPKVTSFILDGGFYFGLDKWLPRTYVRFYAPFVHTTRNLDMREIQQDTGMASHRAGYFTPGPINRELLLNNAYDFFAGKAPKKIEDVDFYGLCFSKIDGALCNRKSDSKKTKNGFGELRAEFGWNFLQQDTYHLGLNAQAAAPTGSRPNAEFLFEPVVGNGKHWEIGGGATGHYVFWQNETDDQQWSINGDMSVLHLIKTRQRRTFDLRGKPLSRYMLAAKHRRVDNTDDPNTLKGDNISAVFEFDNVFTPLANLTTRDVKVSVSAQIDLTAWFNYSSDRFSWDIGYNLWFSSCEKIDCSDVCFACPCAPVAFEENRWAIKGDAQMFGFQSTTTGTTPVNTPHALSASNSKATILSGSNTQATGNAQFTNGRIDRPKLATKNQNALANQTTGAGEPLAAQSQINTSIQAHLITQQELDISLNDNLNRGLSHKLFTHIDYTWKDTRFSPHVGFGVSAEFGKTEKSPKKCPTTLIVNTSTCCPTALITNSTADCPEFGTCPDCIDCALSQWGVWLKGGIQF